MVRKAELVVAHAYEERLQGMDNPAGAISTLKLMGWTERRRVEIRGGLATLEMSMLPDEAVARIAAGEHPLAVLAGLPRKDAAGGAGADAADPEAPEL